MLKWTRKQYILNISILLQYTITINKTNYFLRQRHFIQVTSNWSGYGNVIVGKVVRKPGAPTVTLTWEPLNRAYLAFASQYATEKT